MKDRELLVMAALAAGIKLHVWGTPGSENFADMDSTPCGKLWNPLTDDGDALRLAVKLGLCFGPNFDDDLAVCFGREGGNITEDFSDDRMAATRRAIVRDAAEMGKSMK